jgi:hypothetical protein
MITKNKNILDRSPMPVKEFLDFAGAMRRLLARRLPGALWIQQGASISNLGG